MVPHPTRGTEYALIAYVKMQNPWPTMKLAEIRRRGRGSLSFAFFGAIASVLLAADRPVLAAIEYDACGFPASAQTGASLVGAAPVQYRVRSGDTLTRIAAAHATSVEALLEANSIADPNMLEVGLELNISKNPVSSGAVEKPLATVTGVLVDCHATCRTVLSQSNQVYALRGELRDLLSGDVIEVDGVLSSSAECAPLKTIEIHVARRAPFTGMEADIR
jgi:LysM repeat protein